ncbi:MAG: inosine monophosphate cyclohydrolase, partial [Xanthomonadales bacterium]|nr:inosine monophosphate cyclohydrolase [Xanthomonadales bacterium]
FPRCHVVSNGDQTDTIFEAMRAGRTFEEALITRTFEPDAPNYTPRIAGVVNLNDTFHAYQLGILKTVAGSGEHCTRQFFSYEAALPGAGHCVTTYKGDGDPLPSFEGEPYLLPLGDDLQELAGRYWEALNEDNKVALAAKSIDPDTEAIEITIINKHA